MPTDAFVYDSLNSFSFRSIQIQKSAKNKANFGQKVSYIRVRALENLICSLKCSAR